MMGLGWQELMIVLVIIMIIFGAGKLPEVARSMGQGVKEFKKEAGAEGVTASTDTSADGTRRDEGRVVESRVIEPREMRAEEI